MKDEKGNWITHPLVVKIANDIMAVKEKERGSIMTTTKNILSLYRDSVVAKNTSCSEFHISDLMDSENPIALYIIVQPSDQVRLSPLVRVFMNMCCRLLANKITFEKQKSGDVRAVCNHKHKLLMLLDEFPAWGRLESVEESLAYLAGFGIY